MIIDIQRLFLIREVFKLFILYFETHGAQLIALSYNLFNT